MYSLKSEQGARQKTIWWQVKADQVIRSNSIDTSVSLLYALGYRIMQLLTLSILQAHFEAKTHR